MCSLKRIDKVQKIIFLCFLYYFCLCKSFKDRFFKMPRFFSGTSAKVRLSQKPHKLFGEKVTKTNI